MEPPHPGLPKIAQILDPPSGRRAVRSSDLLRIYQDVHSQAASQRSEGNSITSINSGGIVHSMTPSPDRRSRDQGDTIIGRRHFRTASTQAIPWSVSLIFCVDQSMPLLMNLTSPDAMILS